MVFVYVYAREEVVGVQGEGGCRRSIPGRGGGAIALESCRYSPD